MAVFVPSAEPSVSSGKVDVTFIDATLPRPIAVWRQTTKQLGGGTLTVEWQVKR